MLRALTADPLTAPGWRRGPDVWVLDEDRALLEGVDAGAREQLRRTVAVPTVWRNAGGWDPAADPAPWSRGLGLLVMGGLLTRSVHLDGREVPDVLGPGCLVRPWTDEDPASSSVPHAVSWHVHEPVVAAVLGRPFVAAVCHEPAVLAALVDRAADHGRTVSFRLAIAHVRSAERRLLMLLWHLADRWGTVSADGVHLPLRAKQEVLAHLVALRRPTTSTALRELTRSGAISCAAGGGYVLHRRPDEQPAVPARRRGAPRTAPARTGRRVPGGRRREPASR